MRRKVNILIIPMLLLCIMFSVGCSSGSDKNKDITVKQSQRGTDDKKQSESSTEEIKLTESSTEVTKRQEMSEAAMTSLNLLRERMKEEGTALGIAFLGYISQESKIEDYTVNLWNDSPYAESYPFLPEITSDSQVAVEGQELYVLIPKNDTSRITIYRDSVTDNAEYVYKEENPIFTGEPGEVILLKCNESEIYANVFVTVSDDDEKTKFHPMISLEDGTLFMEGKYTDFTLGEAMSEIRYLYDMPGDWWSKPQKNERGKKVYYRVRLENEEHLEENWFEISVGNENSVFDNWFGTYKPTDESKNEYSFIMYRNGKSYKGKFILKMKNNCLTIKECGGKKFFYKTDNKKAKFSFTPNPDFEKDDGEVRGNYEILRFKDEIQYYYSQGMKLIYTNEQEEIDGKECEIFALGTDHKEQFVREFYYAVSDEGDIYFYNAESDRWDPLGDG